MTYALVSLCVLCICALPVTVWLCLKTVLSHIERTMVVGGLPKDLRAKELSIVELQTQIAHTKEATRAAIAESRATQNGPINIHS